MGRVREPQSVGQLTRLGAVVYGADAAIARWVGHHISGYTPTPGVRALGVIKGKALVAGVTYERFNGVNLEVSIAAVTGSRWADRATLFALFDYPFNQLGCRVLTVTVPMSNLASLNLAMKLGFASMAIIDFAAHDAGPLVVLQMKREQCRWVGNGQGQQQGTGGT